MNLIVHISYLFHSIIPRSPVNMKNNRFFLVLISLMLIFQMINIIPHGTDGDITSQEAQKEMLARNGLLWMNIKGFSGSITTPLRITDLWEPSGNDTVIFGTSSGVYILDIETGEVYNRLPVASPVTSVFVGPDIDTDGVRDIGYTCIDQVHPNVVFVSSRTGVKIWDFAPTEKVYTENLGWHEEETRSWSALELLWDSSRRVLINSWRTLFCLDIETGKTLWTHTGENDFWNIAVGSDMNGDGAADIVINTQEGSLRSVSSTDGKLIWKSDLEVKFTFKAAMAFATLKLSSPKSVWKPVVMDDSTGDGINEIAVGTEMGNVYLVDGASGKKLWEKAVLSLSKSEKKEPTNYFSENFGNIIIKQLNDCDNDLVRDACILVDSGGDDKESKSSSLIVMSTGVNKLTRIISEKKSNPQFPFDGVSDFIVIDDVTGDDCDDLIMLSEGELKIVDSQEGNFTTSVFNHPFFTSNSKSMSKNVQLVPISGNNISKLLVTYGESGLFLIDTDTDEIIWDLIKKDEVEVSTIGDIDGKGLDDVLVTTYINYNGLQVRGIYTISSESGEVLWEKKGSLDKLEINSFHSISVLGDVNGDGINDLSGFLQEEFGDRNNHERYRAYTIYNVSKNSRVFTISGSDGKYIWKKNLTVPFINDLLSPENGLYKDQNCIFKRIVSADPVTDMTGDGIPDVLILGEGYWSERSFLPKLYLFSGSNGSIFWIKEYSQGDYGGGGGDDYSWLKTGFEAQYSENGTIRWLSSLDGEMGTGSEIQHLLSAGNHTITALLEQDGKIMDYSTIALDVVPEHKSYAGSNIETLRGVAGSKFHVSCWGPEEAQYTWYSDIQGFISDQWDTDINLVAGTHNLSLKMEFNGDVFWDEWLINIVPAPVPVLSLRAEIDNQDMNNLPGDIHITDSKDISFEVYERNKPENELEEYNISFYSDRDGKLGDGREISVKLSSGIHHIHAEINREKLKGDTFNDKIYYNITVLESLVPVPAFNSGGEGRVNEYHFENHAMVNFEAGPSKAAAELPMEHTIIDYYWSIDGNYAGNENSITYFFNSSGEHIISLNVTNELGRFSEHTRKVTSFDGRIPEVKIAGTEQKSFDELEPISLWAETSNFSSVRYIWKSELDGILENHSSSVNTYLSEGVHTITLEGTASSGYISRDTMQIKINGGPDLIPQIEFPGKDNSEPNLKKDTPFQVRMNVDTQRRNIDINDLAIRWEANGVQEATGQDADITLGAGEYDLEGIVEGFGQIHRVSRYIIVRNPNAPFAVITSPANDTMVGGNVDLRYESRGHVQVDNVTWDLGDGNISYENSVSHIYSRVGSYTVNLSARNDTNATYDNRSIFIEMVEPGYPVPVFPYSSTSIPTTSTNINFDGSGSYPSGPASIDNYTWSLGDGNVTFGAQVNHTYEHEGSFVVRLTVRDTGSNSSFIERTVKVYAGGDPLINIMNFNDISHPNDERGISALSSDLVNISAQINYFNTPQGLYTIEYTSDIDGFLGAGNYIIGSLNPGLHSISCSLIRNGISSVSGKRILMVYADEDPEIKLNVWDETENFNRNGLSFPAGHRINFDVSSSKASANSGLSATFDNISFTFSGQGNTDNPQIVYSNPTTHYFITPGSHSVTVELNNNLQVSARKTFPLNIYRRTVDIAITRPYTGILTGREGEDMEMSVETNTNNHGFASNEILNIEWRSSLDGIIDTGRDITGNLSKGYHDITVTVDNGKGLSSTKQVSVRIKEGAFPIAFISNKANLEKNIFSTDEEVQMNAYNPVSITQNVRWISSIDGVLGEGGWLGIKLSPGIHNITLESSTSEDKISRDNVYVKVAGGEPLITITRPDNNSIMQGLYVPAGSGGGGGKISDMAKVEFLSQDNNFYRLVQQSNGSYHVLSSSWDRIFCGLITKTGNALVKPVWTFPDTFLSTLGNSQNDPENKDELPRLSDFFPYIDNFDPSRITVLGDVNGDGVDELGLQYWGPGSNGIIILDISTGLPLNLDPSQDQKYNALKDMERYNFAARLTEGTTSVYGDDYNDDGYSDVIVFDKWSEEWEEGPGIMAISGKDNQNLWEYKGIFRRVQTEYDRSIPMTFIDDVTGDGIGDVAVASVSEILILDGASGKPSDRYKYQKSPGEIEEDENPPPVSFISEVDDFSGDGKKDLVLLYQVETEVKTITELKMIETEGYTSYRTIPLPEANILSTGDVNGDGRADLMLSTSDLVFRLDSTFGLNILNPSPGSVGGDVVSVSWDKNTVRCELFVDRISWGYYDNGMAELTMTGGEHVIEVRLTDDFGGTISDTVVIDVPESTLPMVINYTIIGVLILLFLLSIVLPMITRARREKQMGKQKEASTASEEPEQEEFITSAKKNINRVWTRKKSDIRITSVLLNDDESLIEYEDDNEDPPPPEDYNSEEYEGDEGSMGPYGKEDWPDDGYSHDEGGDWLD